MLAAIALCVATSAIIRRGRVRHAWVTLLPLTWLVAVTLTAGTEKIFSPKPNIGFLAHAATLRTALLQSGATPEHVAQITRLIWNDRVDAAMTGLFIAIVTIVLIDAVRVWTKLLITRSIRPSDAAEDAA
jgi:carbon starvation protein